MLLKKAKKSPQRAKIFMNGRSQAVRLPKEFRFDYGRDEVFIRKDSKTGDVILSRIPASLDAFFELQKKTSIPDDFLTDREQPVLSDKNPLDG